jgi:hypothetical protein
MISLLHFINKSWHEWNHEERVCISIIYICDLVAMAIMAYVLPLPLLIICLILGEAGIQVLLRSGFLRE